MILFLTTAGLLIFCIILTVLCVLCVATAENESEAGRWTLRSAGMMVVVLLLITMIGAL